MFSNTHPFSSVLRSCKHGESHKAVLTGHSAVQILGAFHLSASAEFRLLFICILFGICYSVLTWLYLLTIRKQENGDIKGGIIEVNRTA